MPQQVGDPRRDAMALTYIWSAFFVVGFLAALGQWLILGDVNAFKRIVDGTFESARFAVMDIALPLAGVMTLWMGILAVGEKAGAIDFVARLMAPFFSRIFPGVPRDHPANGLIVMNYSANFLGLDNAATPIGLKAMESLQTLNPKKDEATDAQLAILGAKDPSDIFIPTMIATFTGTLVALIAVGLRQRIRLTDPVVLGWLAGLAAFLVGTCWYFATFLTREQIQLVSNVVGNLLILSVIVGFIAGALYRRANVYEVFIDGAKGGIQTSLMIIPFLVGMLVAIGVLRNSGVLDMLVAVVVWALGALGLNADFAPSLPTALRSEERRVGKERGA